MCNSGQSITNRVIYSAHRWVRGLRNYGNPFTLYLQRRFYKDHEYIIIIDRDTGLKFKCKKPAEKMFGETFHTKVYDVPLVPLRQNDIVIDVGANHGFFSSYAARAGASVYAFEPQSDTFECLTSNLKAQGLDRAVRAFPWAVGGKDGVIELYVTNQLGGGMSTISQSFANQENFSIQRQETATLVSINSIFGNFSLDKVRMMKLDCEGSEYEIFQNISASNLSKIDAIAVEYHPEAYQMHRFLDLLLSFDDFFISQPNTKLFGVSNAVLHLVNRRCIREALS